MGSSFVRRLRAGALWVEEWFAPPICVHCGKHRWGGLPLCRSCLRILRDSRPEDDEAVLALAWVRAAFRLTPPQQSLIHGFKYSHLRRHIRFLCAWLRWRKIWIDDLTRFDAIVPVPLHPARKRERGYNQSELIALEIGHMSGTVVMPKILRRVRFTSTQTKLGHDDRARNLENAFRADAVMAKGKRILLVDDVCTTGSTLGHCRDELLRAGAVSVEALVLAWVEKREVVGGG